MNTTTISAPGTAAPTPYRARRAGLIALALTLATCALLASSLPAAATPSKRHSNTRVAFSVTEWVPEFGEALTIEGAIHVGSTYADGASTTIDLHANLAGADAVGLASGNRYRLTGSEVVTVYQPSPPPIRLTWSPSFRLAPSPPPIRPEGEGAQPSPPPIRLALDFSYHVDGSLRSVGVEAYTPAD